MQLCAIVKRKVKRFHHYHIRQTLACNTFTNVACQAVSPPPSPDVPFTELWHIFMTPPGDPLRPAPQQATACLWHKCQWHGRQCTHSWGELFYYFKNDTSQAFTSAIFRLCMRQIFAIAPSTVTVPSRVAQQPMRGLVGLASRQTGRQGPCANCNCCLRLPEAASKALAEMTVHSTSQLLSMGPT